MLRLFSTFVCLGALLPVGKLNFCLPEFRYCISNINNLTGLFKPLVNLIDEITNQTTSQWLRIR